MNTDKDYVHDVCGTCVDRYTANPTEKSVWYNKVSDCGICGVSGEYTSDASDHPWFSFRRFMVDWTDEQLEEHHQNIRDMNPDGPQMRGPTFSEVSLYKALMETEASRKNTDTDGGEG